jgi:hypothetical protein
MEQLAPSSRVTVSPSGQIFNTFWWRYLQSQTVSPTLTRRGCIGGVLDREEVSTADLNLTVLFTNQS